MNGKLSLSAKLDSNKSQISVNPVNNINVKVLGTELKTPYEEEKKELMVEYPTEEKITITKLQMENEALKVIIDMLRSNPILINKLILADDEKLALLVKLLTNSDEVHIDAEDLGEGCCTAKTYRKVNAIYVIKDGNTKNLKYDYPDITKELKDLGISTKYVW